jgi:hypothetical protein
METRTTNSEIAARAAAHGIGAVAIARPNQGEDFLALLVSVPFAAAEAFADELAFDLGVAVHLFDPWALPFSHPLHFRVDWVNGDPPRVPVPRGAVLSRLDGIGQAVPLSEIAHFAETDGPVIPRGDPFRVFPGPPLGAFLL